MAPLDMSSTDIHIDNTRWIYQIEENDKTSN